MKAPATRFEELVVWQKAYRFVLAAYSQAILTPESYLPRAVIRI
jgi:hypothetical protein